MSRYSKRERLLANAEALFKQERATAVKELHLSPERILMCNKYGDVYYSSRKDSTTMIRKGDKEVQNKLSVEGKDNPLLVKSKLQWGDDDLEFVATTDKAIKSVDSKVRKLGNADNANRNSPAMVRIGTTPERTIRIEDKDTGELRKARIQAKPRFVPVGLHNSVPLVQSST